MSFGVSVDIERQLRRADGIVVTQFEPGEITRDEWLSIDDATKFASQLQAAVRAATACEHTEEPS